MSDVELAGDVNAVVRRNRTTEYERIGLIGTVTTYLVVRVIQWFLSLPTIIGPDSHSYLPGSGLAAPPNWYFGLEKVSLTGDGVIRPWTVTLPYAIMGADFIRSFVQMLLSAVAFLLLAWVLWKISRSSWLGIVLGLLVLTFSLTTLVTSWDMLLNRESIAISLTAILIAIALLAVRRSSWTLYLLVNLVALLLTITRPTIAPFSLGVLAAIFVIRLSQDRARGTSYQIASAGVGLALMVVSVVYPAWISGRMDESWKSWYGQTMSETQFGYVVSDYNPRVDSLKAELVAQGAPTCLTETIPVYTGVYVGAPWGFASQLIDSCPEFSRWYAQNWPKWYYGYLASNPDYIAKLTISGLPLALYPWDNGVTTSLLPSTFRDLYFPDQVGVDGEGEYDPLFLYWALIAGVALTALTTRKSGVSRLSKAAGWLRGNWPYLLLVSAMLIGSLISITINLLLIPSYPLETNRVNVSTALLIRGAGVVVAVLLVWRAAGALLRRKAEAVGDE